MVDQLFNSTEKRLARALLLLARYGKEDQPQRVLPKVSQETLAETIGMMRSRVNLFMNKFKKMGFIKYNGGLQVNSSFEAFVLHELGHLATHFCSHQVVHTRSNGKLCL